MDRRPWCATVVQLIGPLPVWAVLLLLPLCLAVRTLTMLHLCCYGLSYYSMKGMCPCYSACFNWSSHGPCRRPGVRRVTGGSSAVKRSDSSSDKYISSLFMF